MVRPGALLLSVAALAVRAQTGQATTRVEAPKLQFGVNPDPIALLTPSGTTTEGASSQSSHAARLARFQEKIRRNTTTIPNYRSFPRISRSESLTL